MSLFRVAIVYTLHFSRKVFAEYMYTLYCIT